MLLDIDDEIFDATNHQPVLQLLEMVADRRHDWYPTLAQAEKADALVRRLIHAKIQMPMLEEWVQQAFIEASNPIPVADRRTVPVGVADLQRAVADLAKPAVLLVENEFGDGGFVRAVAVAFGDDRIIEALERDPKWLTIYHGGGKGQMPQLAAARCREFSTVVRVAVLYDSDRKRPGPSENEGKVKETRDAGVDHVHLWTWRMMENYVPLRVWDDHFPLRSDAIDGLRRKAVTERGYIDIKRWLVGGGKMPFPLFPDELNLTREDFEELGMDAVEELQRVLSMINEIL